MYATKLLRWRVEKYRIKGHRTMGFFNDPAFFQADWRKPPGDNAWIPDGGRQQKQRYPGRKIDHDLFPDHTSVFIAQKMRFVKNNKIGEA